MIVLSAFVASGLKEPQLHLPLERSLIPYMS
jgi:hypothetical protein